MSDAEERQPQPKLRWFQMSLRTLLATILGFGLGLAVNYQFRSDESKLPNPSNVRRGDSVRIQWRRNNRGSWSEQQTATVLADGTIRLRELGSVPAAGISLDELTEDLKTRYEAYYARTYGTPRFKTLSGGPGAGGGGPGRGGAMPSGYGPGTQSGGGGPGSAMPSGDYPGNPLGAAPVGSKKATAQSAGEVEVFVDFGSVSAKE